MNEAQLIGYAVTAIITLGGFIAIIMKFTQPINDLRIVIQKLNDNIDALKRDNEVQSNRITKHGEEITTLKDKVGKLEFKMDLYHEKE